MKSCEWHRGDLSRLLGSPVNLLAVLCCTDRMVKYPLSFGLSVLNAFRDKLPMCVKGRSIFTYFVGMHLGVGAQFSLLILGLWTLKEKEK